MNRIKQLSPEIISAIAAGEVIQRPAHAIKELIENSLDAQATEIAILLKDSGLTEIEVIDNGHGVDPDDLILAVTPHATSKLSQLEDFATLQTQGFRGEALASIAQVSHLQLSSRVANQQAGYTVKSEFGNIFPIKPLGMPAGTRVTVTQLFSKSPIRQSFLNQSTSELRHIVELVTTIALAQPEVGFELKNNNRTLVKFNSQTTLIERNREIFGSEVFSQLLPLDYQSKTLRLTGFISQPSLWTKRPTKQYLFINQRPVRHTKLQKHLHQLTNSVQANTLYPIYSLYLELDPITIDVNIHPQKSSVDIFNITVLNQALDEIVPPLLNQRPLTYSSVGEINYLVSDQNGKYKAHRFRQGLLEEYHQSATQQTKLTGEIQQLENLYLLVSTNTGLLLVDQHALHERLLYDELKDLFQSKKSKLLSNKIPVSLAFDLTPGETFLVEEYKDHLNQLGIEIEPFGTRSFKVNSVPEMLADHNILDFIKEVLDQAAHNQRLQVDTQTDALLASMACKLAIKAGDYVSPEKRLDLIQQLLEKSPPGTCPHGRPIAIKITLSELNKLFKRS